jgi:phosphonate transport system substrate-binding protein
MRLRPAVLAGSLPLSALILSACGLPGSAQGPTTLTIDFVPAQASSLRAESLKGLTDMLARDVGMPVQARVPSTYAQAAQDLVTARADAAWLTPIDAVYLQARGSAQPVTESVVNGQPGSRWLIIVGKGSKIGHLSDLKGHSFAVGEPASLTSHVYPLYYLRRAGLNPARDLTRELVVSSDAQVAVSVCNGGVDAGAIVEDARTIPGLDQACPHMMDRTAVIFTGPRVPGETQAIRSGLDRGLSQRLARALEGLAGEPHARAALEGYYGTDRLAPVEAADYQDIRQAVLAVEPKLLRGSQPPSAAAPGAV